MESQSIDWPRLVMIGALAYSAGACSYSFIRLLGAFAATPNRLWLARITLRICTMGFLFFATDTAIQNWGEPLRIRNFVLFGVLLIYPWSIAELTADVMRDPEAVKRSTDPNHTTN